ncbi:TonB-dependent receptor [candidate division KSB1 bacterium]|nr:TonB-dependent receptor [candidate division KSB1 bacterium]
MDKTRMIILVCLFFITHNLYAQVFDLRGDTAVVHLPKLIITANRYEKNIFETHIPANIIGEREIWQRSASNLPQLIERLPGVSYSDAGPWSQKLVLRGLVGPQVLTLVDGMRLNVLRSYGNHAPLIDPQQIERVEVIRGPASILYGSDAIGGVVNIITKKPDRFKNNYVLKGDVGLQYHSVNQQNMAQFTLFGNTNNWDGMLDISRRTAEDIETPKGTLKNTAFSGTTVDASLGYNFNQLHRAELRAQLNRMDDVGVPVNPYAADAKFLAYDRDMIQFAYNYNNPTAAWNHLKIQAHYQKGKRNFEAHLSGVPKGALFVNQLLNAERNVNSYGANIQTGFLFSKKNMLTAGVDIYAEFDDTKRIADPEIVNAAGDIIKNPPADLTPPTPKSSRRGIGIFLENEYNPWKKWTFTFGTRYDYIRAEADATSGTLAQTGFDKADSDFSASFGSLFRLTESVHLIANLGQAFKAPTLQERFFKGTAQVGYLYGNPDLESEKSLNIDAGMKWKFALLDGELNVFRNRIDNLIVMNSVSTRADTFRYDNVGEAELYGGEFQTNIQLTKEFLIFANASVVRGTDVKTDSPLPKIPPLRGLLGMRYENQNGDYWLELSGRFVDEQNRVADNELKTAGYNLFDISTGIDIGEFFESKYPVFLTCNIRNVFDVSYRDHLSYVTWWDAPGRNIIVGLRSSF